MAQRQNEFEEPAKAMEYAKNAEVASEKTDDEELKTEIKEFLASL